MSVFPPSVYRDRYDLPTVERHTRPTRASTATVVVDRRVTHAGYVEVTRQL